MKKSLKYSIFFGLILVCFGIFSIVRAAFPGEGLTISPPISEPKVKPGQTVTQTIRLTNPTDKLVEVYPQAMDFKAKGDGGQPAFYNAAESGDKFSLAKWISFNPAKIALTPEQEVDFNYKLTVPLDAEPGGHYGAIFFVSEPPKDNTAGSKVSVGSMVGSLVLMTVPGDTIQKGLVESFATEKGTYVANSKVNVITKIANVGNVHFKPIGTVNITNAYGKQVSSQTFNDQNGNVLPDSTRKFVNTWTPKWNEFGMFKANLDIKYGDAGVPLTAAYTFWVLPVWVLGAGSIALFVIVLLIVMLTRMILQGRTPKKSNQTPPAATPPTQTILR